MRVMGIDPGTLRTGWGVAESRPGQSGISAIDWGVVRMDSATPIPDRLSIIYGAVKEIIHRYKPDAVAIESVFFAKNASSALKLGHARAAAILAARHAGLPVAELAPTAVKRSVAGYGRAGKDQVQRMVGRICNLDKPVKPADSADALAIAICRLAGEGYRSALSTGARPDAKKSRRAGGAVGDSYGNARVIAAFGARKRD